MGGNRNERAQKQWAEIIREYSGSGLSKKEYCKEKGVSEKQFYYHQRRMRESKEEVRARQPEPHDKSEACPEPDEMTGGKRYERRVVKLKISEAEQETGRTVKFTANGMSFTLSEEISPEFLAKLLKAVSRDDTI